MSINSKARRAKYMLMMFAPGDYIDSAWTIESETPFQPINVGDIIHSDQIEGFASEGFTAPVAQVVHHFWSVSEETFTQQTCVYLGPDCWNNLQEVLRAKVRG